MMIRLLKNMIHRACTFLKPLMFEYLYPMPTSVDVFLGKPETIEHAIVAQLLVYTDNLDGLVKVSPLGDEDKHRPAVWVENQPWPVHGCMSIARYLGRLWRMHPTAPEAALAVDGSLELLQLLVHSITAGSSDEFVRYVVQLEERFEMATIDNAPWMEGFNRPTVADVCWLGAFRYLITNNLFELEPSIFPHTDRWWRLVNGKRNNEEDDYAEEETEEETEDEDEDEDEDEENDKDK